MKSKSETLKTIALVVTASWLGGQFAAANFPTLSADYAPGQKASAGSEDPLVAMVRLNSGGDRMVMIDPSNWQMTLYTYDANRHISLRVVRDYRYDMLISEFPIPKGESLGNGSPGDVKSAALKILRESEAWKKHSSRNGLKRAKKSIVKKELEKFALAQIKEAKGKTSLHVIGNNAQDDYLCLVDRENQRQVIYQISAGGTIHLKSIRSFEFDAKLSKPGYSLTSSESVPVSEVKKLIDKREADAAEKKAEEEEAKAKAEAKEKAKETDS